EGPDHPMTGELQRSQAEEGGAAASAGVGPSGPGVLYLLEDGAPTRSFVLDRDRLTLGRLKESDVPLPDPGASRRHAEVRRSGEDYVLVDLGSTNGTMVNDQAVSEQPLRQGDRITIGRTVLEF